MEHIRAVVQVQCNTRGNIYEGTGTYHGTGFFISPNTIITNSHVVDDYTTINIKSFYKEDIIATKLLKQDPYLDLALIQVDYKADDYIELGPTPDIGDHITGIGFALTTNLNPTIYSGMVQRLVYNVLRRYSLRVLIIETDMVSHPGDSGSPILNDKLQYVGVRSQGTYDSTISQFIPACLVRMFLDDIKPGFINMAVSMHNSVIKFAYNLPFEIGDKILEINDMPVSQGNISYNNLVQIYEPGNTNLSVSMCDIVSYITYLGQGSEIRFKYKRGSKTLYTSIVSESMDKYIPTGTYIGIGDYIIMDWVYFTNRYDISVGLVTAISMLGKGYPIIAHHSTLKTLESYSVVNYDNIQEIREAAKKSDEILLEILYKGSIISSSVSSKNSATIYI